MRDSQRRKFWTAKIALDPYTHSFESLEDTEKFIKKVTHSAWFKRRYSTPTVVVTDGRRRRRFGVSRQHNIWTFKLPVHTRTNSTALILISYTVLPLNSAWHGREFTKAYLELTQKYIGEDAAEALKKAYVENRVRYRTKRRTHEQIVLDQLIHSKPKV